MVVSVARSRQENAAEACEPLPVQVVDPVVSTKVAGLRWLDRGLRHHTPVEEEKEGAIALDNGVVLQHFAQGGLVKGLRIWYHCYRRKPLAGCRSFHYENCACKFGFCQVPSHPLLLAW